MTAPAGAPAVPPPPRLDPFALPAATTARFLLMIVVAVTSAVHLYLVLLDRYAAGSTDLGPRGCALAAGSGAGRIPDGVLVSAYVECVQRDSARTGWVVIGMVAGLLAVAVVIHLLHPRLVMLSRPRPLAQFAVDEGMAAVVRRVEDTVRARPRGPRCTSRHCARARAAGPSAVVPGTGSSSTSGCCARPTPTPGNSTPSSPTSWPICATRTSA
ncbi:hypothetical protein ACNF49_37120 [Actinomadura sp. ATCC 39365]